jgi:hypothetical protein
MGLSILAISAVDLTFIKDWFRCVFWLALGLAFLPQKQADCQRPGGITPQAPLN